MSDAAQYEDDAFLKLLITSTPGTKQMSDKNQERLIRLIKGPFRERLDEWVGAVLRENIAPDVSVIESSNTFIQPYQGAKKVMVKNSFATVLRKIAVDISGTVSNNKINSELEKHTDDEIRTRLGLPEGSSSEPESDEADLKGDDEEEEPTADVPYQDTGTFEFHVPGHKFLGPGTNIVSKLKSDTIPANYLDWQAMIHDVLYLSQDPVIIYLADEEFVGALSEVSFDDLPLLSMPVYSTALNTIREKMLKTDENIKSKAQSVPETLEKEIDRLYNIAYSYQDYLVKSGYTVNRETGVVEYNAPIKYEEYNHQLNEYKQYFTDLLDGKNPTEDPSHKYGSWDAFGEINFDEGDTPGGAPPEPEPAPIPAPGAPPIPPEPEPAPIPAPGAPPIPPRPEPAPIPAPGAPPIPPRPSAPPIPPRPVPAPPQVPPQVLPPVVQPAPPAGAVPVPMPAVAEPTTFQAVPALEDQGLRPQLASAGANSVKLTQKEEKINDERKVQEFVLKGSEYDDFGNTLFIENARNQAIHYYKSNPLLRLVEDGLEINFGAPTPPKKEKEHVAKIQGEQPKDRSKGLFARAHPLPPGLIIKG